MLRIECVSLRRFLVIRLTLDTAYQPQFALCGLATFFAATIKGEWGQV
jgi:hypothetical protein